MVDIEKLLTSFFMPGSNPNNFIDAVKKSSHNEDLTLSLYKVFKQGECTVVYLKRYNENSLVAIKILWSWYKGEKDSVLDVYEKSQAENLGTLLFTLSKDGKETIWR